MHVLRVDLDAASYRVIVGRYCLSAVGAHLSGSCKHGSQAALITTKAIPRQYARVVLRSLRRAGCHPTVITLPDGETVKSLRWSSYLYDRLVRAKFERGAILLALGGGVIGDLTGFVASTYLRGVKVVHIPTTLVAQVDASIGGKTGVNHPHGKNLIGTFYQPKLVFIDVASLRTLPKRELIGGMAEVIKYGIIADPALFTYVERNADDAVRGRLNVLERIVYRSARIKARVVEKDEREAGLRRILNYGHTLGHAVEAATGYDRFHHGEAIAIGMEYAARLSVRLGLCNSTLLLRQRRLLERIGLPTTWPPRMKMRQVEAAMALDKKVKGGRLHFVLPTRVGAVTVLPVERTVVHEVLQRYSSDR